MITSITDIDNTARTIWNIDLGQTDSNPRDDIEGNEPGNSIRHVTWQATWTFDLIQAGFPPNLANGTVGDFGYLNEWARLASGGNTFGSGGMNMDLWNNRIGRDIGLDATSHADIRSKVEDAYRNGDLITNPNDPRQHSYADDYLEGLDLLNQDIRDALNAMAEAFGALGTTILEFLDDLLESGQSAATEISGAIKQMAEDLARALLTPVCVDLDNDGLEYIANTATTGVFFDIDADGFAEKTEWLAPDDGFLVHDTNSNDNYQKPTFDLTKAA